MPQRSQGGELNRVGDRLGPQRPGSFQEVDAAQRIAPDLPGGAERSEPVVDRQTGRCNHDAILGPDLTQQLSHRHEPAEGPDGQPDQQEPADDDRRAELYRLVAAAERLAPGEGDRALDQEGQREDLAGRPPAEPETEESGHEEAPDAPRAKPDLVSPRAPLADHVSPLLGGLRPRGETWCFPGQGSRRREPNSITRNQPTGLWGPTSVATD